MPYPELFLAYWVRNGEWDVRIDGPHLNPPLGQRHVHIRKRKGRKGEYSWNLDGTRHDKGKFPENEREIEAAKRIAANHLRVDSITLQFMCEVENPVLFVIIDLAGSMCEFTCRRMRSTIVLANDDWLIFVQLRNENEPDH